jgi:hypothetical protein
MKAIIMLGWMSTQVGEFARFEECAAELGPPANPSECVERKALKRWELEKEIKNDKGGVCSQSDVFTLRLKCPSRFPQQSAPRAQTLDLLCVDLGCSPKAVWPAVAADAADNGRRLSRD